jgi:uncharacterized ferredoxin-like protein
MNEEADAVVTVASLMALSARTAPKAKGTDALVIRVARGSDLALLAEEMRRYGEAHGIGFFLRDAGNVAASDACLLIGAKGGSVVGIDCGGCGYSSCDAMLAAQKEKTNGETPFRGPNCAVRMADLGIAVGSAAKTAAIHNVDNRIMYSAGVGALQLDWLEDCFTAYGIPLKAGGKNIYFDRSR